MANEEEKYAEELRARGDFIQPEQAREFVERGIIPEHAICIMREREAEEERSRERLRKKVM